MLNMRSKQTGLSFVAWLSVVLVFVVVATLALRIAPHYIDYRTIITVVDSLPKTRVNQMSGVEIRDMLKKRLKINNIRDLEVREIFDIDRGKVNTVILLNYERREKLIGNMHVVMMFDESFEFT